MPYDRYYPYNKNQQFKITYNSTNDTYTIYNEYTSKYLAYTPDYQLVFTTSTSSYYNRNFKIVRDTYWEYTRATYSIEAGSNSATYPSTIDYSSVVLKPTTSGGSIRRWSFMKVKYSGIQARFYAFDYIGFDTTGAITDYENFCQSAGFF